MKVKNQCACCGKFRKYKDLQSAAGDSDDCGNYEEWFECRWCFPADFEIK